MKNKKNLHGVDLRQFLDFHAISDNQVLQVCGIHRTTLQRWLSGESKPPVTAMRLLEFFALGEPPCADRTWHDWRFVHGGLRCALYPRRVFMPRDILMIPAYETQVRELADIKNNYALQSKLF